MTEDDKQRRIKIFLTIVLVIPVIIVIGFIIYGCFLLPVFF